MPTGDAVQQQPSQQWKTEVGDVDQSLAVASGVVYGTSLVGQNLSQETRTGVGFALDAESGELRWRYEDGGTNLRAPAVGEDLVYLCGGAGVAVERGSGTASWEFDPSVDFWSTPTLAGDRLYVEGGDPSVLYEFSNADGGVGWETELDDDAGEAAVGEGLVVVGGLIDRVKAVSAEDGSHEWTVETGNWVNGGPVIASGNVFAGSDDDYLYKIDAADGNVDWRYDTGGNIDAFPVVTGSTVIVASDRKIQAINTQSGAKRWEWSDATYRSEFRYNSPVVVDDTVYVTSTNGTVVALSLEDGSELWSLSVDEPITTPLIQVDGTLYLGTGGTTSEEANFFGSVHAFSP